MKYRIIGILGWILISCSASPPRSDAYGTFEAIEYQIAAESNGRILELNLQEGQTLETGVCVGYIDTLPLVLKKNQIIATRQVVASRLEHIRAQMEVFEEQKKIVQKEKERITGLLQSGSATIKQLDEVQGQLDVLEKQKHSVEAQCAGIYAEMRSLDVQISQLDDQIRRCYFFNPVRGTVLNQFAEPYEMAVYGKPLYQIANLDVLDLRVYVDGSQLPHIRIGQTVRVLIDEDKQTNRELPGTVAWISSKAEFTPKIIQTKEERVNMVYAVKIRVRNDGTLKIGMPGEVLFE